ncbi:MAG: UvrD-helicase domain-containing protein, partial [bacterium]|nr:UvrD-helicase domain-containing protein [bacterium]
TFLALVQSTYIPDQTLKNELINKIQLITACTNLKDQQKLLIELNELASIISKLRVKKVEDHNNNFSLLKQKCDEFKDIFYEFGNLEQNIKILNYSRTILKLYKAILANYEQKKFEKSYLDYDDLQLKTKELLKNSDVRNYLSNKFKYIMIDEYQDTNFLQYEIFLPLLDELKKG